MKLLSNGKVLLNASQPTFGITCLGQILLTSVSSTPMTLQEIQNAGIQLQPGDYVGRRFEMVLSVGSQQISLNVPVAIPVYNGLVDPRAGSGSAGLQIGNITGGVLPGGLCVVMADIVPKEDPFTLSRPSLSFQMRNNFKALLVIPGSIGYLKQIYKVNVVVFNALPEGSPFKVTHLSATWRPPAGLDGQVGTEDDPLQPTAGENLTQALIGPDGQSSDLTAGQAAMATFSMVGNREGSHAIDFGITGQFEGGGLDKPVAITGIAQGKVLVQNPNFNLMLMHPDVVRRGQTYTLEAHLTNTSQTLANAVSLTIDKARLAGAQLVGDATQQVDTLLPGQTTVMKFQLQAFVSGQVTSSYMYIDPGNTIGFQLTTGIGPRHVTLNPDTLVLPDSLVDPQTGLPKPLREAMLALLGAAYDVATSQKALPDGVMPIARGTITTTMAETLSQEGLFLGMGLDRVRVWWDLWALFTQNPDPGFDQLMRTTQPGADLRNALLAAWPWADPVRGPPERIADLATFNAGLGHSVLVGIQGAAPGLLISLTDANGGALQTRALPLGEEGGFLPSLSSPGMAVSGSNGSQFIQCPIGNHGTATLVLANLGTEAQTLSLGVASPVDGQAAPTVNTLSFTLQKGMSATISLGTARQLFARLTSSTGASLGHIAASSVADAPPEPFQVLGVHRYDLSVAGSADPYGTQVMVLFNRPTMPLNIPAGEAGFQAAAALVQVEANAFWRKVMAADINTHEVPASPAALLRTFPRVISCYLEKPVGPYVQRTLALASAWKDDSGNPLQGRLQWPIQSGLLPGGSIVKGHFRKLDGTGVPGRLTYWYQQNVNNASVDLATGYAFSDEEIDQYYALITNNVATEGDGAYQLDFVPAPIGSYIGPFVLQGGFTGGTAFSEASVLGNGGVIQMDLVLEGSGSVDGYVVDAQGQPIAGAQVLAIQAQRSSDFTRGTGGGSFSAGGVTDAAGHYHVDGLKTGIFSLQVLKDELGAVSGGQISTDGQMVSLTVVLQGKVGTLKARVLDPQGNLRKDQPVRLGIPSGLVRSASAATTWVFPVEATPGPDGWATFTKVPAGDVKLIAPYAAPTPAADWQGFLDPEQTLQVELRMAEPNQLASVQALVVDAAGRPVAGAYLKFNNAQADLNYVAQTREDGTTTPVTVLPGSSLTGYIYHPSWVGFTATNSVVPQPGGSYVLKAVLPARCVLTGKVTRPDGTPVARAYVALPPVYSDNNKNRLCITNAQGLYSIPNVPAGTSYRVAAVGPELLTAVNVQIPVASTDTALTVNLTLPAVAHNTLSGTVYQPLSGNNQRIPSNATVQVNGTLPDISSGDFGNLHWGLPQTALVGGISEGDMPPTRMGQFSIPNLPAGPYTLTASSSLFPSLVTLNGDFGTATAATSALDVFLSDNAVGLVQGRVVQADGQTPVAPGARVTVMVGGQTLIQVLTQPGGSYAFPKVIPPSSYPPCTLRVEDPQTGNVVVQPFELKAREVKTVNLRLWGTGDLTVNVQDSQGKPMLCAGTVTCGTITLQHSKANLVGASDLPLLALPLTPADQGNLLFPHLLEGLITVQLKDPSGLSGVASVEILKGGGNQTVTVRLQPVGRIQGTLLRADGTSVAAGRVDAYQGSRWLGTCPTFVQFPTDPAPVAGHFMFDPLPTGAIRLEAWDPDSRQTGEATVPVLADQTSTLTMNTLDTGNVTIQVLQEGQPVLKAGIDVAYQGGPALLNAVQATADENGLATFILPPGSYTVHATDPVSLASGTMSFTRELNATALSETLSIQPVRSVLVTALPPPPVQGQAALNLAGWRVSANDLNRAILLDSNNQGTLQEMPIGLYTLELTDDHGRSRGSQSFRVTTVGGPLQMAQVQARAFGNLRVTVLEAGGSPASGVAAQAGYGESLFTDTAGQAVFYGIRQGTWVASATRGSQRATGTFVVTAEGEWAQATITFAPTAALHGVVRDPFGLPVPFVAVACNAVPDTATDRNGAYAFQGLPLGQTLTITARTASGRIGFSAPLTLSPGDDPEVDITLLAVGVLLGQVTDALRPTLPAMQLQVLNATGQMLATSSTDQLGAFRILNLPAGQTLTLKVLWDDGTTLATQQAFLIPGEGQSTNLSVPLPPFVNITGWTLDASGSNLPMYVQLQNAQGTVLGNATTTVDIPTFYFRYLKAGQAFQLEGFQTDTLEALALTGFTPAGQTLIEHHALQVAVWSGLKLQLRYPDGSGAPGGTATAHLQGMGGLTAGRTWDVAFDASGAATLPSLPPGPVRIQVNALPWQGTLTVDATIPQQAGVFAVDLPILGTGALELQLRYPDGSTAPGAGVQARIAHLGEGGTRSVVGAFDGNGHLLVNGLPLGSAQVTVSGLPWQGPVTFTVPLLTQGQTVAKDVAALATGTLKIRLHTTLVPGHDITQATVTFLRGGQGFPMALQPDGTFQAAVPIGEALQVQVTGYVTGKAFTQAFGALAQSGTTTTNVFGVPALGQVHGRVSGADGQPRPGVPVLLNDNSSQLQATATDSSGNYRISGVEVGETLSLVAQDPLIAPIAASLTLSQEGQDFKQDFQLKGFASLTVHATRADNGDAPGIQVTLAGSGVAKQGNTDATGKTTFTQVLPDVTLTVSANFASGAVSKQLTLQSLQSATVELKETPRTHLSGRVRRQTANQIWPAGAILQVSGAASANLALNPDGTFQDTDLTLTAGTALHLTVSMAGLSLPLPGNLTAQPGGQTVVDPMAAAFGSLQGSVTLAGTPVPAVAVRLDTRAYLTDANGFTPLIYALMGGHRFQVSTRDGMAWADTQIQTDGQTLVVPLALQNNAVALPANLTLERLGLAVSSAGTSWLPTLGLGIDWSGVIPTELTAPPQGYWVLGGQSLAWEKDQGDVHVTRILSSTGYGLRDQLVFENRGTVAHALSLSARTGVLQAGQNPQLGTANQTGGAWFSGSTFAWGKGAWVPTSRTASSYYSGIDTLLWPALTLQPGQSYSIWMGYAPHGQDITISNDGDKQTLVSNAPEAATRALQRMIGQAPEWLQNLDARISNSDPAPTVTDTLPAWDGSATLNLLDPTGQPVQALGAATTTLTLTPKELLAPQAVVTWNTRSRTFQDTFLQVPPDGLSYVLATPTPLQGDLAWGQFLDLPLGQDWAVAQFRASANQLGNHAVNLRDDQQTWSTAETLTGGAGLRWTTQAAGLAWLATEQDNGNISASGTAPLAPGTFTPIPIQFPAYGSLLVQGPSGLAQNGYLGAATAGKSSSSRAWASGGFFFPALPTGTTQITGTWNLGSVQVQEGVTTTLAVPTGSLLLTALDVNGVKLSGAFQVILTKDGIANSFNNDSGYTYANPKTIAELPAGDYAVGLRDPASGVVVSATATISASATTSLTLQLSQNGSLSVMLQYAGGAPVANVLVTAAPANGNTQYVVTNASGFAHFMNLGTGTASLTYSHAPGADSSDEPGVTPSLVTLVPGSDLPVTLTVPKLGAVTIQGVTQADDALPSGYSGNYSIANVFRPGRRQGSYYSAFQGVVLGQPLVVRFGDGSSYAPVEAPAAVPTSDGQTLPLTFPLGRLRVRLRHQDQSAIPGIYVVLSVPGASNIQSAITDGTGVATFPFVPIGAVISCNATSGGSVQAASNVTFTGPVQQVELTFPATISLTAHLHRSNPNAALGATGWTWSLAPGSDNGGALPANSLDPVFTGLYPGANQTVTATQYLNDDLSNSNVGTTSSHNATWTASLNQTLGQSATTVTLTLPTRASARLVFQGPQGQAFTGNMLLDTLTVTMKQSTNPGLLHSGTYGDTPAYRPFSSFDAATLPEVFTEGTHVLSLHSSLWGNLPDITFTVGPQDDGSQLQVPVVLDWLKTSYILRATAGDGQTPVNQARFQLKAAGTYLGSLAPSSYDGMLADTDAVRGQLYVPRGRQVQFSADFNGFLNGADGTSILVDTGWVDGSIHAAGETCNEGIPLPLTAALARLTDTNGYDLTPFAAEIAPDKPLPMVRLQGLAYAAILGVAPGPLNVTLYDPTSGLGLSAPVTVLPVGQSATLIQALPPYAWFHGVTFQSLYSGLVAGTYLVGVSADSPGLVKPGLAQWTYVYVPLLGFGNPWHSTSLVQFGGQILYSGSPAFDRTGFHPPGLQTPGSGTLYQGVGLMTVRVPLQGTLWAGAFGDALSGNPAALPGPFASRTFSLNPGETYFSAAPTFQEPYRIWVDVPLSVQDGGGNPYAAGLHIPPLHAPQGWAYSGSSYLGFPVASDATGNATLNLPQGETLRIEIAPPSGCGIYWYGFLDLTIPTPVPLTPFLLKATSQKGTACP